MGVHSIEGGFDTTHTADRPDRALIEHRMRVLLSTIACEIFDVPVPPSIDEDTVIEYTPAHYAAAAWRDEMYAQLGLSMPVAEPADESEPGPAKTPDAPAADNSGKPRLIATIPAEPAPDSSTPDTTWLARAKCADRHGDKFFPVGTSGPALDETEQAKAVCRGCPVKAECLSWALATGMDHGVWGGMSEDERRAYKLRNGSHLARAAA